jgi:hypothetical protein
MRNKRHNLCRLAGIGSIVAIFSIASAEEFVLLNVHDETSKPYTYYQNVEGATGPGIPKDWTQPVVYVDGSYHTRFIIHKMGNGQYPHKYLSLILTMRDNPGKDDAHIWEKFVEYNKADVGKNIVVEANVPVNYSGIWYKKGAFYWNTEPAYMIRIQLRIHVHSSTRYVDINSTKADFNDECAKAGVSLAEVQKWIFPIEYDYQAVVVSKGATFSGWENYPFKSSAAVKTEYMKEKDFKPAMSDRFGNALGEGSRLRIYDVRGVFNGVLDEHTGVSSPGATSAAGIYCICPGKYPPRPILIP